MSDVIIRAEHISKVYKLYDKKSDRLREALSVNRKQYYHPFFALNDVSIEVERGETVGIIGTNGSGKSTLLKIITGVTAPSSGTVEVKGRVSALLELGAGFNPEYTGLQNIDLQGTMMGFSPEEMSERREKIIRFADIGDYIGQPVKSYSSGMFARLAFAVAISIEPEILIVDEALSVGDVFFQSKCFRKFDELREKGTSILFVSHDTAQVRKMCSRVLWIERGVQQIYGNSEDVCKAYYNQQMRQMNARSEATVKIIKMKQTEGGLTEEEITVPSIHPQGDSIFSDKVEILSVYVKNTSGDYVGEINADEEYAVGVVSKAKVDLENIIVGFVAIDVKGVSQFGENTFANGKISLRVRKDEILQTEFTFTMPRLQSGSYEISPAVAQGSQECHVMLTRLHGVLGVQAIRKGYELTQLDIPCSIQNKSIKKISFL